MPDLHRLSRIGGNKVRASAPPADPDSGDPPPGAVGETGENAAKPEDGFQNVAASYQQTRTGHDRALSANPKIFQRYGA